MLDMTFQMNRLREIREHKGMTLEEVANAANTTLATIQRFETGTRNVNLKWLEKLAKIYGVGIHELVSQSDETRKNKKSMLKYSTVGSKEDIPSGTDLIPIYGTASGAGDTIIINFDQEIGHVLRHPSQAKIVNPWAFRVHGDSMAPRYRDGELAFVNGGYEPSKDEDCVIELNDGGVLLKMFIRKTAKEIIWAQLNPPKESKSLLTNVRAFHEVVGRGKF